MEEHTIIFIVNRDLLKQKAQQSASFKPYQNLLIFNQHQRLRIQVTHYN